jgi:hypothetical protein
MRRRVGQCVEQEVREVTAEHLFEPCTRRERLRTGIVLDGCDLG